MAKFKIKDLNIKLKIVILTLVVLIFTSLMLIIFNSYKNKLNDKENFLSNTYLTKNTLINNSQRLLNSFIVFNHISYEKLDDFVDIQNTFFQTSDSINFYIKKYSEYTNSFNENNTVDNFNAEFQKFQNIIYAIFNEYKNEEINLKNISRLFNKELISYQELIQILNNLEKFNNISFKKSVDDINENFKKLYIYTTIAFVLFILIFAFLLVYFFKDNIKATKNTQKYISKLSKGNIIDLPKKLKKDSQTQIYQQISKINQNYKRINDYINELINNNYEIDVQKYSENDIIAESLNKLTDNLLASRKDLEKRKEEDKQKEWANKGMNLFADLMRQHSSDLQKLTDEIIKNFVKYLEASVGGLFIIQDEENDPHLELISAFAYDRKKYYSRRVNLGEGLIGTVAVDKSTIYLNDIPNDYLEIESGLGDAPPNNLLIIPLLTDNGLLGVVEMASFRQLQQFEIDFSENLARTIASTLESVKINARTVELLKESQKKSDELAQREKVLQETMQEVSKAHEVAKRNEIETRGILSGVDQTLMRAEYSPKGTFINSNMVHRRVMGYDIEVMKGKNILEFIQDEEKASFKKMWDDVASGRPYQITVKRKNKQTGAEVWLLNQYTPIKDDEGKVIKILYLAIDITEQKQAEEQANKLLEQAKEKESELQGILSGVDRTILRAEYTPDGIFINSNQLHRNIIGYQVKEMRGKSILEFIQDEEKDNFKKFWKEIKNGKSKELTAKRINKQTNQEIWLHNQYNPIVDENNKIVKILYLATDITEQKKSEQRIEKLLKEAKSNEIELKGIFAGLDQTLMRAEYSPEGEFIDSNDIHQQTLGYDIKQMRGKNIMEFIQDEEKAKFSEIWANVQDGKLEQITVKRKNKETNEDIWLLNQYTPITDELGNVSKILYLAIDITEQKNAEQRATKLLKEARSKEIEIESILTSVDQTLMRAEYTLEGDFIDSNENHKQTLAYDIEQMRGKNILEFVPQKERDEFKTIWDSVKAGNLEQATVKRKNRQTNEDIWLLNQYTPVKDDQNNIIKILYLAIDITEQKQTEQMAADLLQESKKQEFELNAVISSIDQTLIRAEYSVDGKFIDANKKHIKTLGYDFDKMKGQNILEFIPDNEKNKFFKVWEKVKKGIPQQTSVKRFNKETNNEIWLLNQYTPVKDLSDNITKILYLAIDITEQKQAERMAAELLEESQKQEFELGAIISAIDKTILRARYSIDGTFIDSNDIHREIMGYNIEDMYGKNILEFIPDNEKNEFKKLWEQLKTAKPKTLIVHRFNKKTGDDIWLQNEYTPILDIDGKVTEILYLGIDITQQKQLEKQSTQLLEKTKENQQELQGLLSGVDQTLMRAEYSPKGKFLSSNKIHRETLGYDYKKMIGKNIREFVEKDEIEEFNKIWEKVIKGEAQKITVKRENKKTGNEIWLLNQYTPLLDENENITKILYLAIDISEQKRLEQELLVQEQVMNQNMEEIYSEYEKLEQENEKLKNIEKNISQKFDSETDKLYKNWLDNFD